MENCYPGSRGIRIILLIKISRRCEIRSFHRRTLRPISLAKSLFLARSVTLWIFARVDRVFISPCWRLLHRIRQPFFSRPTEFEVEHRFAAFAPSWSSAWCFIRIVEKLKDIAPSLLFERNVTAITLSWKIEKKSCRESWTLNDRGKFQPFHSNLFFDASILKAHLCHNKAEWYPF